MTKALSEDAGRALAPDTIQAAARQFADILIQDDLLEHVSHVQTMIGAEPSPGAGQAMEAGFDGAVPFDPRRDLVFVGPGQACPALEIAAFDGAGRALLRRRFDVAAFEAERN